MKKTKKESIRTLQNILTVLAVEIDGVEQVMGQLKTMKEKHIAKGYLKGLEDVYFMIKVSIE